MTPRRRLGVVQAGTDPESALRALYATHWAPMVRLAALLLGSTSAAEEVVQDAFVALYRRWSKLTDQEAAAGYLRTSVVNGCRSWHRHQAVELRHREPPPPGGAEPTELAEMHEHDARVLSALRTLPRRQQEVLVLRYYADASESEIAALCGISRGAVKSHAHRGMAALRETLGEVAS